MPRVSTVQMFNNSQENIIRAKEHQADSLERSSSLKELARPSQNPAEWMVVANLKDDVNTRTGIYKNAELAKHVISTTDTVLANAQDLVQKIHGLALQSTNTAMGENVAQHVLPEVNGLYQNFIQNLNTKFAGKNLLGGFANVPYVFDNDGNFYGDNGKLEIEIDQGVKTAINVSGRETIFGEGLQEGVNIIAAMQTLIEGLQCNDREIIGSSLQALNKSTDQLSIARTKLAGNQSQIERAVNAGSEINLDGIATVAKIEEVDAVKAFSDLTRDQTVLRAALESTSKILKESPADILLR